MQDWRQRLYDGYVSTGQAGRNIDRRSLDNPYFEAMVRRHLPADRKEISIVDLACGYGRLLHALKKAGFRNIRGVDISREQVELAHRLGVEEAECQDIGRFLEGDRDAPIDVAFLMDILEHLEKDEVLKLLDQVHGALAEGGTIVLHVPNAEGLFGMRVRFGDFTHADAFTPGSVRQVLNACGFRDVRCFEDKPTVHGLKSFVRFAIWQGMTLPVRLLLAAETGGTGHVLSQNMLVTARKGA